jgi:neurofibromin 1
VLFHSGLGYHDDLKTRISFIEVLTSILKQGAQFNSLADTALADRFNSMLEMVARDTDDKGDFPVMMALTNAVPPENLVRWCP